MALGRMFRRYFVTRAGTLLMGPRTAMRMASGAAVPKPDNADTAAVLAAHGVDVGRLKRLYPRVLRYEPTRIVAMIAALKALEVAYAKALNCNPRLWGYDPGSWEERLAVFRELGVDVAKLLDGCPGALGLPAHTLRAKVEAMRSMGLDPMKVLKHCPNVLSLSAHRIGNTIAFLNGAGLDGVRVVNSFPVVLGYSVDNKLRPVVHFVSVTMGRDVTELHNHPACFGYSISRRLVPRFEFAVRHQKQHLRMWTLFGTTDTQFVKATEQPLAVYREFVTPQLRV